MFLMATAALAGGIAGTVVDQATGMPIAGAMVTAVGDNGQAGTGQTGERGQYEIGRLAEGTYRVQAEARGYEPAAFPRPVTVPENEIVQGIDFALAPSGGNPEPGGITGLVLEARTGNPIAGAMVTALGDNGQVGTAQTNERGRYEIGRLAEGTYRVRAQARGYEHAAYPRPVAVRSGEITQGTDFALVPAGGNPEPGGITGRVTVRRSGDPIAGAVVVAVRDRTRVEVQTNERGVYLFRGLEPGRYELFAMARGYERSAYPWPVAVHSGMITEGIDFQLVPIVPAGAIGGVVIDAGTGRPLERAVVVAEGENGRGRAVTNARGYYCITELGAGMYRVVASRNGYMRQVYRDRVPVRSGETTEGIDFALSPNQVQLD
jgi:uncharacterized surface anchored protein